MPSEAAAHSDFSEIRYAQCWEDADVLLRALQVEPGDTCLSIASAGDNTLSLLTGRPRRVIALDLSPAQLACLELRVAAYRSLTHPQLLELIGSTVSDRRAEHYQRCRPHLSAEARDFWDRRPELIASGIGSGGRFERYFRSFRRYVMPLIHSRRTIERLLAGGDRAHRQAFYENVWNNRRWRALFRLFFSRRVMGRLGRSPAFFRYVEGSVAERILERTRHALVELDPAANPYLQWILCGRHATAWPHPLRPENFELIRDHLDRLEWHCTSIEDFLSGYHGPPIRRFNLSDVFEYVSPQSHQRTLQSILAASTPGARLAYWNMLVPRSGSDSLADRLRPLTELADTLHCEDKAFFYSRFIVEEVTG